MPNDLQGYLQSVPTDNTTRANAWDAFNNATDQNDFQGKLAKTNLPNDVKADLWDAKYNGKALTARQQPQAPPPTPQASNPSPQKGLLARALDWAQKPVDVGHLRDTLVQQKADSESAPSVEDSNHPALTAVRKGLEGFGADAGNMLLTPLSMGLAAAGPVAEGAGKLALAAKLGLAGVGAGFGVHGASDLIRNPTPKAGESTGDYIRRAGGDAAMITGGAAGIGSEAGKLASNVEALKNPPANPIAPTPQIDPAVVGQDRLNSAVGNTAKTPETRTVYVDPKVADALEAHKANGDLPGKRVIVTKTNKVRMANTDPEVTGFQYNDMKDDAGNLTANTTVSDEPKPGKIPVTLSSQSADGQRGTAVPGHYLDWQVDRGKPSEVPEAIAESSPSQPQPETPATPPAATEPVAPPPTPPQPVETKPVIKDKVVVPAEPSKGIQEVKLPTIEGGVRPGLPEPVPINEAAPLVEKAMEDTGVADLGKKKPTVDTAPLEEKLKPMLGNLMRAGQLREGEAASHAIDIGMRETRDPQGSIPSDVQKTLSDLLGEPVGQNLHPGQMLRLEEMRGAERGTEPQVKNYTRKQAEKLRAEGDPNSNTSPEEESDRFDRDQMKALEMLHDPNISDSMRGRLTDLIQSDKPFKLSQPEKQPYWKYPEAKDLDPTHPEAPFSAKSLGHDEITPINIKNLEAMTGGSVWKKHLGNSTNPERYLDKGDLAKLDAMKQGVNPELAPSDVLKDLVGSTDEEGNNTSGMQIHDVDYATRAGSEAAEFERGLHQKALSKYYNNTLGAAKGLIGQIKAAGGVSPELRAQLDALAPSVKRHLPGELFDEKSFATPATDTSKASNVKESVAPAPTSTKPKASPSAGKPTPYEGIKTIGTEEELLEKYPGRITPQHIDMLQKGIADRFPEAKMRQKIYKNTLATMAEALEGDDDFALTKGVEATQRQEAAPNKAAGLGLNPNGLQRPFTPDEAWLLNHSAADNMLHRWEDMTESQMVKKKKGLWADSITERIDGATPFSDDPVERLAQTEAHNELIARHEALKQIVGQSDNLYDSLTDALNNFIGRGLSARTAEAGARITREVGGVTDRNNAIMRQSLDHLERFVDQLPVQDRDRFWDNMSRGREQSAEAFNVIDPDYIKEYEKKYGPVMDPNDVAARLRSTMDAARDRVIASSGNLQNFFTNYTPGLWDNNARGKSFTDDWVSRNSLQGDTHFLQPKIYQYYSDALKAGLQPTTSNFVRASMMITEQLNRYSNAHELRNGMLDNGLISHFQPEETPPTGWERVDDKLFNQGPGGYWGPNGAVRQLNNFTSAGLRGKWKVPYTNLSLYDALKNTNSMANQMQLGLSLFHGVETMLNSGFTSFGVGLKQVFNEGKLVAGVGNMLKLGTVIQPVIEDTVNGAKGLVNYRDPTKNLKYAQFSSDLESARANVIPDPAFKLEQVEKLRKNFADAKDNLLPGTARAHAGVKAALNVLGSGVEAAAWPIMNGLVPRVKLGAFYRMADQIHSEFEGQPQEVINSELQKAWDSVDNRFGQVSYQNMFMNKMTQDLATLAVRSPGWNIGTVREVGGGVVDLGKSIASASKGGEFKLSNRTAYTGAMVLGTMWFNGIFHYIHTGQMPSGKDFFFPWDGTKTAQGEKNRVYPKTYIYDFINLIHDPVHTVEHKAAPDISTMADIINNEDYYHRLIRDPGASVPAQAASTLAYMAHQFVPFSISNMSESNLRGSGKSLWGAAGVLPAPRWVGRTPAENLAYQYYLNTKPSGGQSPQMLDKQRAFVELRNKVASGQVTDDDIQKALDSGKLSPTAVKHLYDSKNKPQIVSWASQVRDPGQMWNIWQQANPNEKKLLFHTVMSRILKDTTGEEQEQKMNEMQKFLDTSPDIAPPNSDR